VQLVLISETSFVDGKARYTQFCIAVRCWCSGT